MNSNRNKKIAVLVSAMIAAGSITSQAAVTATSVFDGTHSVITLSFTEGIYTVAGDANGAELTWIAFHVNDLYDQDAFSITSTLTVPQPLSIKSINYHSEPGFAKFLIAFNEAENSQTISGGTIQFSLLGNAPSDTLSLENGTFSGSDDGLTITTVPEPSGSALILLGGISMLARRKR